MSSFSKKEALRFGWTTFKARPWVFVGATALIGAVSFIFGQLSDRSDDLITVLIAIVGTFVQWWLFLGFVRMTLAAHAGAPVTFAVLFGESWKTLLQYVVIAILTGILVAIGFVLLIVPGFIVYTMLALAPFLLLDRRVTGVSALKESRRITEGHRWNLFLFILVMAVLNVVGALAVWVGLLLTVPVTLLAFTHVYKAIEKSVALEPRSASAPVAPPAAPAPTQV